jgi:DNA-binding NtrC family response regulator
LKKKILVADDNPAILDALEIMLEDEGYEVETTVDGVTARDMKNPCQTFCFWISGCQAWTVGMFASF